jgi:hypothetical protein
MKQCREELATKGPRSQEFKDALRLKFIEQAKKYIGVPYAERYKKPEDPIAPLYLDCCGLVRKVVQDLAEEFGFLIGRWNQCYMLDTLPITKSSVEELKPGDLIFYEATFNNPKRCKPQKHNCTHVEIYLGGDSGEATLGSRYFRGKVSIYDSYKFTNDTWTCYKHHFRSLDTWLHGICESHCPEHPWILDTGLMLDAAAGKRSIFNNDSDDENAGVYYDETDDENAIEELLCKPCKPESIATIKTEEVFTEEAVPEVDKEVIEEGSSSSETEEFLSESISKIATSEEPIPASLSSLKSTNTGKVISQSMTALPPPLTYYVSKANGWKLIKASLDKRGWQQLPFEYQFSSRFALKWVERRSEIDYRAHTPGQLVCHIPNNEVISTKSGLLSTIRDCFCRNKKLTDTTRIATPWLPETYQLDIPIDVQALVTANKDLMKAAAKTDTPPIWIYKPSSSNRGRGIKVIAGNDQLNEICYGRPPNRRAGETEPLEPAKGIVQKYIENPLLIPGAMSPILDHSDLNDGYKFDYRCYMLVARNSPKYMVFFHPGYIRLTMRPYSDSIESLADGSIHLTNASIQKKQEGYKELKAFQVQSIEDIAQRLESIGKHENAKYMREGLNMDVKRCMVDVMKACHNKLLRKDGFFDLFGLDFMVTSDNEMSLLEVNTNPALALDNDCLRNILPEMIDGCLELVTSLQGAARKATLGDVNETVLEQLEKELDAEVLNRLPGNWNLIMNERSNNYYSGPKGKSVLSSDKIEVA